MQADHLYVVGPNTRFKWSCTGCRKRNDHPVPLPIKAVEIFVCKHCKHPSRARFEEPKVQA